MPDENPLPEVIERVAHAVEKGTPSDPPKEPKKRDWLKSWASFFTAVAALLAAAGAFIKTFDHSITENAYNTLSGQIEKLSDQQQKNHEDLVALQGYLDGLQHAPLIPSPTATAMAQSVDAGTLTPLVRPPRPLPSTSATAAIPQDAGPITFAIVSPPPLPSVHPKPPPVKPPPWSQVAAE